MHFMAENAPFFSLLEAETGAATQASRREGTAQHVRDVRALVERGQAEGAIVDEDAELLALGVVGTVGYYSHCHRTGRTTADIDDLARFVARAVVRTLAADEAAATDAQAG